MCLSVCHQAGLLERLWRNCREISSEAIALRQETIDFGNNLDTNPASVSYSSPHILMWNSATLLLFARYQHYSTDGTWWVRFQYRVTIYQCEMKRACSSCQRFELSGVTLASSYKSKYVRKYKYIIVRPKASWTGLICRTYQLYHRW